MQTNEPLNTASIQAFIQQVKGAEACIAWISLLEFK